MFKSKILRDILDGCYKIEDDDIEYDEKILQLQEFPQQDDMEENTLKWDNNLADSLKDANKHWGQLKLFLSEVAHLANYIDDYDIIVYAGAAPGIHIVLLTELFPHKRFFLFDPNPIWDVRLREKRNVVIRTGFFDDTEAHRLSKFNTRYFLISDIRNLDIGEAKRHGDERGQDNIVENDMNIQFGFWHQLQPDIALFKFRLMRGKGLSKFPTGQVYLPIYGKHATAESRLLIKGYDEFKTTRYDNENYRQRMFYHHANERNDAMLAATVIYRVAKVLNMTYQNLIKKIKSDLQYRRY